MCPIQRLQKEALSGPVSDFIKSHKLCDSVTAQYQKKKQKSNLAENYFQYKALLTQSRLNISVHDQQDQHTQRKSSTIPCIIQKSICTKTHICRVIKNQDFLREFIIANILFRSSKKSSDAN